jgi:hypothetical protein
MPGSSAAARAGGPGALPQVAGALQRARVAGGRLRLVAGSFMPDPDAVLWVSGGFLRRYRLHRRTRH